MRRTIISDARGDPPTAHFKNHTPEARIYMSSCALIASATTQGGPQDVP